jgi:Concanavalin A-like lectin/glucanases superfamily
LTGEGRWTTIAAVTRGGGFAGITWLAWALAGCMVPTAGFVDPRGELRIDWVFDAEDGVSVPDEASPAEDLALVGGTWTRSDGPPHLQLDGVDDMGLGPDLQAWLPTLEAVTLEALVRIDAQAETWDRRPIVTVPQTSDSGNYALALNAYSAANRLELGLVAGDEHVQVNDDQAYTAGQWIVVHGVYDGEAATLYVDGEPVAGPYAVAGALDPYDFNEARQEILVGGPGDGYLACGLALLRLYGRALAPEEVAHRHRQLAPAGAP